jgi:bacteriocin biosynthesis cyclodehydratase domain-containing protein
MPDRPKRPKVRPYLRMVVLAPDRMLIKGGTSTVVLSGPSVQDVASVILPAMDGSRTMEQIVAEFEWIEPSVVFQAIDLFQENGLLEDAASDPPAGVNGATRRYRYQTTYWLSLCGDRHQYQKQLAAATVAIFGLGGVGTDVALSLAAAGVGRLVLFDPGPVTAEDALFGHPERFVGQPRTVALRARLLERNPATTVRIAESDSPTPDAVPAILRGADLGLFCSDASSTSGNDYESLAVCEMLNAASLASRIPWTRAVVDHHQGVVGPSVIPYETACLTCFRLRLRSNMAFNEDAVAYDRYLANPDSTVAPAILGPFATLVASYAAIESVKLLTRFARPNSAGAFVALNSLTGEFTRHDVLRLPRCPDCGPAHDRPQMKIWDLSDPR